MRGQEIFFIQLVMIGDAGSGFDYALRVGKVVIDKRVIMLRLEVSQHMLLYLPGKFRVIHLEKLCDKFS